MRQRLLAWVERYERHLSALAMVVGFIFDSLFFERVDIWQTQVVFAAYTLTCLIAIPTLQWLEGRREKRGVEPRLARYVRALLPLATQFALGGFWSGFVVFYGRSAVLGASWPFLVFLVLVLLGSEYFSSYHARLVFTSVLFFFALYSYTIFALPVYTGVIGATQFLVSGAIAVGAFAVFTLLLRLVAGDRFKKDVWRIRAGAITVLVLMNIFYFTDILPPLPLSAVAGGVYHELTHVPGSYIGATESESWSVAYLGVTPTLHFVRGDLAYAYSAVFAPTSLTTKIVHQWQWYNPMKKSWVTRATIAYPIVGGRDAGYRGYSQVYMTNEGSWRVDIKTGDGRLVDRIPFSVLFVETEPETTQKELP